MSDLPVMRCVLCHERTLDIEHHLGLFHPGLDATPEIWADGQVVVIDTTLEPEDFA